MYVVSVEMFSLKLTFLVCLMLASVVLNEEMIKVTLEILSKNMIKIVVKDT